MFRLHPFRYIPLSAKLSSFSSSQVPLSDNFNREHNYLRVSLTEKCNLRCRYCMPEGGIQLAEQSSYLSLEETKRLVSIFVKLCGINKVRLTGGEPSIDRKLDPLLQHLNELRGHGLRTVAMTTNGLSLKRTATNLKSLGLDCVNISLDTLRADRFELMTRRKGWNLVHQGILAALKAKFESVKVNCVVIKGFNDDELADFAALAQQYPIEVRFIEFMPFAGNKWADAKMMPYKEMLRIVREKFPNLVQTSTSKQEVSKVYRDPSMQGTIGFISSMSDNFCSGCNRLRLTSDGHLKVCLFGREETSLRDLMRNGANDTEIVKSIASSLKRKKRQHAGASYLQNNTWRPMVKIGARSYHSSSSGDSTDGGQEFSHLTHSGEARMVNVGSKDKVRRVAIAQGSILVGNQVLSKIRDQTMKKGDIISIARVAGIMGAKWTSHLIPLCHTIPLDHISIDIQPCYNNASLKVTASAEANHNTGVEMESLTAVTIALLTLYDMCKSVNKSMIISDIKLLSKNKY